MKFLLALGVAASMLFVTVPANAGNNDVVIGVIGGAIGGLIVGEAIGNHHHHRHRHVRVYDDPYDHVCYRKWVWAWDPYLNDYIRVRRTVCE